MQHLITGNTRVLGIIADPLAQAKTPILANDLLVQRGVFGRYVLVPFNVGADGLAAIVNSIRSIRNFGGAVISMPHKTSIVPLLDALSDEARAVGAVNVIRRNDDNTLSGTVLDGEGFVSGLRNHGHSVIGKHCLLVGAGGAASAIAYSLLKHHCASLTVVNRSQVKAEALVNRMLDLFPNAAVKSDVDSQPRYDIAINATSLGMQPTDALPLDERTLTRCDLIAECVITQAMTPLLNKAHALGHPIHVGLPMLQAQLNLMLEFMGVDPHGDMPTALK